MDEGRSWGACCASTEPRLHISGRFTPELMEHAMTQVPIHSTEVTNKNESLDLILQWRTNSSCPNSRAHRSTVGNKAGRVSPEHSSSYTALSGSGKTHIGRSSKDTDGEKCKDVRCQEPAEKSKAKAPRAAAELPPSCTAVLGLHSSARKAAVHSALHEPAHVRLSC